MEKEDDKLFERDICCFDFRSNFLVLISILLKIGNELYKLRASVQILSVCCILYPHDCTSEINKYCLNQDWKGKMINCLNEILLF